MKYQKFFKASISHRVCNTIESIARQQSRKTTASKWPDTTAAGTKIRRKKKTKTTTTYLRKASKVHK